MLAVIVLSAVLAYARGLVRETLSIAGWIVAALAGFAFAPMVEPLMREVPVLRDIIGTSCELGILAGFAAVFAVALIIVSLVHAAARRRGAELGASARSTRASASSSASSAACCSS